MNIVITSKTRDPFSRVPKTLLNDKRISWKAKGILSYLIGKPVNWKIRVKDICNQSPDGEIAVRSALKELRDIGYAKLSQIRENDKIARWELSVADSPIYGVPDAGKQDAEKQDLGNTHSNKKEVLVRKKVYTPEGFDAFWSAYPRKVVKAAARKAWIKVDIPIQTVLSSLEQFKKTDQWRADGGKWIPYPSTWLNGKRWEDEVIIEKPRFKTCL